MSTIKLEIQQSITQLKKGNVILYPTDTVWGLGCDARNPEAIAKIYQIKERDTTKPMLCMVSDFKMLRQYVQVQPEIEEYLKNSLRPTTVIYPEATGFPTELLAKDGSVAIRVVTDSFCTPMIKKFGGPIVSTSANISNHPNPSSYEEIEESILEGVDYIVNLQTEKKSQSPSRLIRISEDGSIISLRD